MKKLRRADFQIASRRKLKWLRSPAFARGSNTIHAFSTRIGGTSRAPAEGLNLGFTKADRRSRVEENRREFLAGLRAENFQLAELHQIHSTFIMAVGYEANGGVAILPSGYPASRKAGSRLPQGDALVTDQPGILLAVRSADCVPVLIADADRPAVAAVHAGWKGMLEGIVEKTVGEMRRLFGCRPAGLRAAIGPSIRACCYEVSEELAGAFCGRFVNGEKFLSRAGGKKLSGQRSQPARFLSPLPVGSQADSAPHPHLDLAAVAQDQLRRAGVPASHIQTAPYCTACRTDLFFSHRKEGSRTGRMMNVIGILAKG